MSLAEIETAILDIAGDLIGSQVARDQALASQGLDSLAAMELRRKLQVQYSLF